MNVTELIELTNRLSTDKSELTPKERSAYLQYLNMANDELYEIASSGLKTILSADYAYLSFIPTTWNATDVGAFISPNNLFKLDTVVAGRTNLRQGNHTTVNLAPDEYVFRDKYIYANINSGIKYQSRIDPIDNTNKRFLTIFYVPNPKRLVEEINDDNLETDTPVYPLPYHIFLVHGALYYFYFSNKVFMDKMAYIRNVWENDKKILANFKNYGL